MVGGNPNSDEARVTTVNCYLG